MAKYTFSVATEEGQNEIQLDCDTVIAVGYGGRNQGKVKAKLEESAKKGKKVPSKTPINYPCSTNCIVQDGKVQVVGHKTKGEAEFLLVLKDGKLYVGVGSDHTDSELTGVSTNKAKQACPKPIGSVLWLYDEVKDHWDELQLKSWQTKDGVEAPYQDGKVSEIMTVEDTLKVVEEDFSGLKNAIIFGGTVSVIGDAVYGDKFRCELVDPVLGRTLSHEYDIRVLSEGIE